MGISQLPPELVDHPDYEFVRELGRGGMGVVYLAQNKLAGRPEVLKVVGRPQIERPGVADCFLREIRSTAKLHHPNIVTALSAFRLGDRLVLAMEYVEGLDLAKMVTIKGPVTMAKEPSRRFQTPGDVARRGRLFSRRGAWRSRGRIPRSLKD